MAESPPSTARLRKIGRVLRQIREEAGLTLNAAGRRIERSGSSLSLIEKGTQLLRLRDLKHILDVYDVDSDTHHALMTLAAQQHQHGWWEDFKDTISRQDLDYASLENDAARLQAVETRFIPGLLQTEDYARAIAHSDPGERDTRRADRFVEFRMQRQEILRRSSSPHLHVVIDEAALRRHWGGAHVMRVQLECLLDESHNDHVTLQVVPFACVAEARVSGTFMLLDVCHPPILSVILLDHLNGRWILETEEDLVRYRQAFAQVSAVALSESDTRGMIQRIISDL
jgi:transcriptional regulator with XRE-family HTH domain